MREPLIVDAARTPLGTAGKSLRDLDAPTLAAPVLERLKRGTDLPVDEVILGNCMGPGGDVARIAALMAGLGDEVPALTVDRQCASGLAAIEVAARADGDGRVVLAGGVESASTAPWRFWPPTGAGTEPRRYTRAPFAPADRDPDMGAAADSLAAAYGIDRTRQDAYSARSHQRAHAARSAGAFAEETVAVGGVAADERVRAGMTAAKLARLPAAFVPGGTVTVGNSCGINDGAAAVTLTERTPGAIGLRVLAAASAGVDPTLPGIGLVPAVRRVLDRAALAVDDIDVWELNEAFAGQTLACCDDLGLPDDRVCREGGALALGHPWGASGAVLVVRLFSQMIRRGRGRYGIAAIAAGGGQGTAVLVDACR